MVVTVKGLRWSQHDMTSASQQGLPPTPGLHQL